MNQQNKPRTHLFSPHTDPLRGAVTAEATSYVNCRATQGDAPVTCSPAAGE
jgi:hypothetical protein